MGLREKILGAPDRFLRVPIPEWGEDVWIRRFTLDEKKDFETSIGGFDKIPEADTAARTDWMLAFVVKVACDETGAAIFGPEDVAALRAKSAAAVERIALNALRINVIRQEELVTLGNASSGARNGVSGSASPAISG
jgi:hypothetical protein